MPEQFPSPEQYPVAPSPVEQPPLQETAPPPAPAELTPQNEEESVPQVSEETVVEIAEVVPDHMHVDPDNALSFSGKHASEDDLENEAQALMQLRQG